MKEIERDIVCAMIWSADEKLFLGKKYADKGGVYIDCWHIPGGGMEEGENHETALRREMLEETGIDVSPYHPVMIDDLGVGESEKTLKTTGEKVLCRMKFYIYKVVIDDKKAVDITLKLDDDLEKGIWVDQTELESINLTPPSIELFKRLNILKG